MLDPASAKSLASSLLDEGDDAAPIISAALTPRLPGYEILERLGTGGMGVVYKARQLSTGRHVAVKFLRTNPDHWSPNADAAKRLVHEARVLSELRHHGIASILDAGWIAGDAASGRPREPFVAMELVQGSPITIAARGLDPTAIVELFLDVCAAIEHAHVKGVIHRDLKPSNILVTPSEAGRQMVKVVDFGLASLIRHDARSSVSASLAGDTRGVVGTLAYMSPEQFDITASSADTRWDVYALGSLLYELLAKRPAYDVSGLPPAVAVRVMAEHPPVLLASVAPHLPRELPTIVGKAMERTPAERYQSVAELAADLRRFLDDIPILATPPSSARRLRLWVRRNRALSAALAVAGLSVAAAVGGIGVFVARNRELRLDAEAKAREADRDRLVASTVASLLERIVAPPQGASLSREAGAADALDAAAAEFDAAPPPTADAQTAVAQALAMAYRRLSLDERAEVYERKAASLIESVAGPRSLERAEAHARLASVLADLGRTDEAVDEAQLGYEAAASLKPATSPEHAAASLALGRALLADGRPDEAEPLLQHAYDTANGRRSSDDPAVVAVALDVARLRLAQNRPRESLALLDRVAAASTTPTGPRFNASTATMIRVAALTSLSEFDDAYPLAQAEIARLNPLLPPGHPRLLRARLALADVLIRWARPAEAFPIIRQTLDAAATLGPAHPIIIAASLLEAQALRAQGLEDDASSFLWAASARLDPASRKHVVALLTVRQALVYAACDAGDTDDAIRIAEDTHTQLASMDGLSASALRRLRLLKRPCKDLEPRDLRPTFP